MAERSSWCPSGNIDPATVEGFGEEWTAFDQEQLSPAEQRRLFDQYFSVFPFDSLPPGAEGFDLGCGTGRWAVLVAPRVGRLHCIDASAKALDVCRHKCGRLDNVDFYLAGADGLPLENGSQDFGYSLGVLHHIPDTARAMRDAVRKLKPQAPFLVYLYYSFDNRPHWYSALWSISELGRHLLARLPFPLRKAATTTIATLVYWPMSRLAGFAEKVGLDVRNFPLSGYRYRSFYSMRTDALDRFGTRLEQRFSRDQISAMMKQAGLTEILFREDEPFWVAIGWKTTQLVR